MRTCDNAHLLLSSSLMDTSSLSSYEIVFGGYENTYTDIRRGAHGPAIAQSYTPNIMNCDEFLPFWARWGNNILEIGSGPLDSHVMLRMVDLGLPLIQYATVTSWVSAPGEYLFLDSDGKSSIYVLVSFLLKFNSKFSVSTRQMQIYSTQRFILPVMKSCQAG